jgi:arylsulfatase A-like enzyme
VLAEHPTVEAQAARLWSRYLADAFAVPDGGEPEPVFAVVHEIDPHSPYQAPEPFRSQYDFGYVGNIDGWNTANMRQGMRVLDVVNARDAWLSEADRRAMRAAYMAEVSFVDAYVGALLGHLEATGRRDRTLVVFVSDHGEQFFEHGAWGHGRSLYQEEIAVPLVFSLPGVLPAGLRSSTPVELADVAPTILDLLGVEGPAELQGRSLLPDMLAGPDAAASPTAQYARSNTVMIGKGTVMPRSETWDSVRVGRWKLHRGTLRKLGQPRFEYELYDLERDPEEVVDLWPSHPIVGHALRSLLEAKLERDEALELEAGTVEDMDAEVLENLRGLGYVE